MPWHPVHEGGTVLRDDVIAICEQRICDGGVMAVGQKRSLLGRTCVAIPNHLVFSPTGARLRSLAVVARRE